ncbi:MAG: M48 family metallopeptidase [Oscillibacter sp.]|nr:M48 family metallopeptidase [Oscillibacter sp.]
MRSYELIRSRRRTLALELTRDGRVLVRAPQNTPLARIDAFVEGHEAWIARRLAALAALPPPPSDEEIPALKKKAAELLPPLLAKWSERTGLRPSSVRVTSARKRYGSCSARGGVCFSCFLMAKPIEAVELVVVHELCHLRVRNHGKAFYALLERYLPDWRERKKLLR